jgi:broad specificity phosphatase PhoE
MNINLELIFIRHGQGIHNTNIPDRLNYINPRLTEKGKKQVDELIETFDFNESDVFITSPTIRTIETANILTVDLLNAKKIVNPVVGPRMFPLPKDPKSYASRCDEVFPIDTIKRDYPDFIIQHHDTSLWTDGINIIDQEKFYELGNQLISLIRIQNTSRTFIISHDGTITNYRILLGEDGLTRDDFLGEAGWYKVNL